MSRRLVELRDVSKTFAAGGSPWQRRNVRAVEGINLDVRPGETLGVVGESGSGKSTLCRVILGLTRPTTGEVLFDGQDLSRLPRSELRQLRRRMQAVFQDSSSAFNPRHTVRDSLLAPLDVHAIGDRTGRQGLVEDALHQVGLDSTFLNRHPHALSGGERQRVAIARAIILRPALVVADEPTSALDVSVQARILNLFRKIQSQLSLTYVFVSHNLGIIRYISDRVAVMYLGEIVEMGPIESVFSEPAHPYTRALLKAIPQADLEGRHREPPVLGELPSAYEPPIGCRFHTRCPVAIDGECAQKHPPLYEVAPGHESRCLWHDPRFGARSAADGARSARVPASRDEESAEAGR